MHTFGHFQVVELSPCSTRLRAPRIPRMAPNLAAVRRRLAACDGIEAVAINPGTGSVVVHHSADFSWGSIGAAALRLEDGLAIAAADECAAVASDGAQGGQTTAASGHPRRQPSPLESLVDDVVALVLEGAIERRPVRRIVEDVALNVLFAALLEARRA